MKNTTITTDTDFKLDIEEQTYNDGEKVTYIYLKGIGVNLGFLVLREGGSVSFKFTETNDKPIFKEIKRGIDNNTFVLETTLNTNKVKVGIRTLQNKK